MLTTTAPAMREDIVKLFHCQYCGRVAEQRSDRSSPKCCGLPMLVAATATTSESDETRHLESNIRRARDANARRE
jgi:hypothetical protein